MVTLFVTLHIIQYCGCVEYIYIYFTSVVSFRGKLYVEYRFGLWLH